MPHELLKLLACPDDGGELCVGKTFVENGDGLVEGTLECSLCGRWFPVVDAIPQLLPAELSLTEQRHYMERTYGLCSLPSGSDSSSEVGAKLREMAARDENALAYEDIFNDYGTISERDAALSELNLNHSDILLDLGAGTGRLTREFSQRCRQVVAVDFSFASLQHCRGRGKNIVAIQADLTRLPFRETSFEKVVCCEVLEHLPGAGQRLASLDQIKRVLMPGGLFVCSVYNFSALQPRFTFRTDRVKEGSHDGAIYFFRFTPDELRHMCGNGLEITRMVGLRSLTMFNLDMVLGRLHLTPLALCVERLLQGSPLSCSTGYLLQATMIRNCSREEQ